MSLRDDIFHGRWPRKGTEMSLDREKAKRILDEAYASGNLNRSIIEPDHNEPLGVTDNRCNWCGEPVNAEQTIRELAEALQALLRAERDVVYDRAAIQQAKDALKKAGC